MSAGTPPPLVALFGEVLADVFPERSVLGGAPFNVARHLRRFGLHPLLVTRIGDDALGTQLLQELGQLDIDAAGFQRDRDYPTGQVRVTLQGDGHRFDILPDQAYDRICPDATRRLLAHHQPRLAYFGTLALRSPQSRGAAMAFLESVDCPRFLDINLRDPWYDAGLIELALTAADRVKLNEQELATVADLLGLEGNTEEERAGALQQRYRLEQVLVTCGAAGSWLLLQDGRLFRGPAAAPGLPVVDTVGAGDAFSAVFLLGQLLDWPAGLTLQRAGTYAGALCGVRGAAPPDHAFAARFVTAWALAPAGG